MKRWVLVMVIAIALAAVAVIWGFTQVRLDAIHEPSYLETLFANQSKHLLIGWRSREGIPAAPGNLQASIEQGDKLYATDCTMCHGSDGRSPTDNGRWMYPRASDLTSREVQTYSDRELFWIVKNGIRLSGMPAFGKVESDEHIWNLVNYVRTLRPSGS
ncbi:MAG TPA: cytochrome c [Chthoniobacterales bacterium]